MSTNPVPPSSQLLLPQGEVVEPIPDLVEEFEQPGTRQVIMRMTKFVSEYLTNGFDSAAAAIAAGYSVKYAASQANRLLATAYVQRLIRDHLGQLQERTMVTGEAVVNELAKIAFANMGRFVRIDDNGQPYYDFTEATEDDWAAVTELNIEEVTVGPATQRKVKFKLGPKAQTLHDLGEYFKLFTRRTELLGPNGSPLVPPTVTVNFKKRGPVNVGASGDVHRDGSGPAQAEVRNPVSGRDLGDTGGDNPSPALPDASQSPNTDL
jgi:phage terminase small subunit